MIGLGTLVNTGAVVAGSIIGMAFKKGIRPHLQQTLMQALGMATMLIGIAGTLKEMFSVSGGAIASGGTMLLILSMIFGALIGELLKIEQRLEQFGEFLQSKVKAGENGQFVEGFVTASLVICIGAMAVVGSLQDGISGDHSMLFAKSALDFMIVMVFASTLGVGVLFSALPILLYQGGITLCAGFLAPFLTDSVISGMSLVGNVLIFGVGVNVAFDKQIHVGNMLPALAGPVLYHVILHFF